MPHDEFVLEQFADGGLLMNLETGNLSHLNPSAVEIWSMAIASVPESEIARRLASIHGIAAGRAVRDVDQALRALTPASEPIRPPTDLTYEASGSGYVLSFQGSRAVAYEDRKSVV